MKSATLQTIGIGDFSSNSQVDRTKHSRKRDNDSKRKLAPMNHRNRYRLGISYI